MGITPDDMLKVIMYINDYFKCISFTTETKQLAIDFATEDLKDRVESIMNDISRGIG